MVEPTNETRAQWAYTALEAFARETNQLQNGDLAEDPGSVVSDLLCDLMHYCRQNNLDIEDLLRNGRGNFAEELLEEADDIAVRASQQASELREIAARYHPQAPDDAEA